jgi:hypothetical protein
MHSRWYSITVFLLWFGTMGWLITQKVLPTLLVGEPPSYRTILESETEDRTECWSIRWNERPLGWAATAFVHLEHEMTEIRSHIHFEEVPLSDMMPASIQRLIGPVGELEKQLAGELTSKLVFDPLRRLSQFESAFRLANLEYPVKVWGQVLDGKLNVSVLMGGITYETDMRFSRDSMVTDGISPQAELPGLRDGQTWTVEVYSPFRPPTNPVELLQATVEGVQPVKWKGQWVDCWLVVYRSDPGASVSQTKRIRGSMLVHPDGTVVRQEVALFEGTLRFDRLWGEDAEVLAHEVQRWLEDEKSTGIRRVESP